MAQNTTTLNIPSEHLAQIQSYLEQLQISQSQLPCEYDTDSDDDSQENTESPDTSDLNNQPRLCVVKKIHDHSTDGHGNFKFHIQWSNDKNLEWVNDSDCQCENIISEYLSTTGVTTKYLFCRVSTQNQAQTTSISLDAQETELRQSLGNLPSNNIRIKVYSISQSAYKSIPKDLQIIGEAARKGDTIMVWRVDRLSRNIVNYLSWCENLDSRGVMIYSRENNITYSNNKHEFIQGIMDAQKEAIMLGDRIKMAIRQKIARGDEHIGSLVYGKKYNRISDPTTGKTIKMTVVNDEDELKIIQEIKTSKTTPKYLANHLNLRGIQKRGRKWTPQMIQRIKKYKNK